MRFAVVVLALFALLVSSAQAGKIKPTVSVAPSPTHVGDAITISGCGYGDPKDVYVYIYNSSDALVSGFATNVHTDGCWSFASQAPSVAGTYEIYVFPDRSSGDGSGTYKFNHPTVEYDFIVS